MESTTNGNDLIAKGGVEIYIRDAKRSAFP